MGPTQGASWKSTAHVNNAFIWTKFRPVSLTVTWLTSACVPILWKSSGKQTRQTQMSVLQCAFITDCFRQVSTDILAAKEGLRPT